MCLECRISDICKTSFLVCTCVLLSEPPSSTLCLSPGYETWLFRFYISCWTYVTHSYRLPHYWHLAFYSYLLCSSPAKKMNGVLYLQGKRLSTGTFSFPQNQGTYFGFIYPQNGCFLCIFCDSLRSGKLVATRKMFFPKELKISTRIHWPNTMFELKIKMFTK